MKTVYFVRHGQSESNVGPLFLPDAKLTEHGYTQASFIAERCSNLNIDVIIASTLQRAKETARIIAERIGKPVELSELFVERRNPSEQTGLERDSEAFEALSSDFFSHLASPNHRIADEENFEDLNARAAAALEFLLSRPEENILVVGHGMFTKVLVGRALYGESFTGDDCLRFFRALMMTNTGLTVLHAGRPESFVPWELRTWNDHAHLG